MTEFISLAVRGLQAVVEAGLDAQLRRIEQDDNLPPNSLKTFEKVIRAAAPQTHLGATDPIVLVYDEQGGMTSQRHNLMGVQCSVEMLWTSGTDFEAAEDFGRSWMTAMYRTIASAPKQDGINAMLITDFDRISGLNDSNTRHARRLGVEVRVHSPRRRN